MKQLIIASMSALLLTTACSTVPKAAGEKPSELTLEPMAMPVPQTQVRYHQKDIKKGADRSFQINSVNDDGSVQGVSNEDCSWTDRADPVSPGINWNKCVDDPDWHSGTVKGLVSKGSLWPLEVGNTASYKFQFVDANGKAGSPNHRRCKVEGVVNIDVAIGNVDAYKVVCKRSKGDWNQTRIWYFSPEYQVSVKYTKISSSDGIEDDRELARVEQI